MLKPGADLVRELRSRCIVNAPCLRATSTLLTSKKKACSQVIRFRTDCGNIFCNKGLHTHLGVSLYRWHLLLTLNGKGTPLYTLAWKLSALYRARESISINEPHRSKGSHISTLHFAQTPAVLYLWTNGSLEDARPQAGWTSRRCGSGCHHRASFLTCKRKGSRACLKGAVQKWSHIICILL